jgi:hypothetical protein
MQNYNFLHGSWAVILLKKYGMKNCGGEYFNRKT